MKYKRIGEILVSSGAINEKNVEDALKRQETTGERLGEALLAMGLITEKQLIDALCEQLGVMYVDLSASNLDLGLSNLIPKNIAAKYELVPVHLAGDELYVAMADPLKFNAIEDVKHITGKKIIPMISTNAAIKRAVITLYGNEGATRAIEELKKTKKDNPEENKSKEDVSETDENNAPTIRLVNSIIERAITEQASDIHFEQGENDLRVRFRVDGALRNVLFIPKDLGSSIIARLKVMGGMNTSERRVPQDGRANVTSKKLVYDLRISSLPTIFGEKIVIRILDTSGQFLTRDGIGLDAYNEKRYEELLRSKSGMILISGPTGSGKSSTMNTMVRELNTENVNIVTLEDPIEYNTEGINQVQINEATGMTFANGLRSILRQDPDIISIGEIRDGETSEIAMRAAITGHLVLSTIHTSDAIATIDRLYDIGSPAYLIAGALKGVIAQRLIRKICPNCKEEYEATDEELELLGIKKGPEKMMFARGKGCPMCFHSGYKGRAGVFEILLVDAKIRKQINQRIDHDDILASAKENGFVTISDRCRQMVLDHTTTASEAIKTIYSTVE